MSNKQYFKASNTISVQHSLIDKPNGGGVLREYIMSLAKLTTSGLSRIDSTESPDSLEACSINSSNWTTKNLTSTILISLKNCFGIKHREFLANSSNVLTRSSFEP